jgi:signal transduction histidine kinase
MEIYQIVRELLNNTLKHANATHVVLKFLFNKKHLNLKYSDNGKGMDFKKNKSESKGMGLSNITSRVVVLKGQINIQTKPNNGFTVVIEI